MRPFFTISTLSLIVLFSSCEPGDTVNTSSNGSFGFQSERSSYSVRGSVIDANDNPLVNVDIHFFFKVDQQLSKVQSTTNPTPSTRISFAIPANGYTTLKVFRMGTRELIATLVDTMLMAGYHAVAFNANALTNGVYVYELKSGDLFTSKLMQLLTDNVYQLIETKPLIKTDHQGNFSLPLGVFALEEKFVLTDDMGNELGQYRMSDSIGFVLYRGYGEPTIEWTRINRYSNTEKTFVMK